MTRGSALVGLTLVIVFFIVASAVVTNKIACERGIRGRESLIALRHGFEASAHGRYMKAKHQPTVYLAAEERAEGKGLYVFARQITVHPPNCAGVFPVNR